AYGADIQCIVSLLPLIQFNIVCSAQAKVLELKEMVDQYSEYRRVYEDFAQHLAEGTSLTSTKELAFILKAYKIGNQKGKVRI
ncbi:MAG: hypothetical protein ACREHC_02155, partial [Candidatus Levyibacteriota bacterium]